MRRHKMLLWVFHQCFVDYHDHLTQRATWSSSKYSRHLTSVLTLMLMLAFILNKSCIVKVNHEHLEWCSGQRCSTGHVLKLKRSLIKPRTNHQLKMVNSDFISCQMIFHFEWEGVGALCFCCMFFSYLHWEWRIRGFIQYILEVGGCDRVLETF